MKSGGKKGYFPPEFSTIEAAKELGCSFFELYNMPIYWRNMALAKISADNELKAEEAAKRKQFDSASAQLRTKKR